MKTWYVRIHADSESDAYVMLNQLTDAFEISRNNELPLKSFTLESGLSRLTCNLKKKHTDRQLEKLENKDE